MGGALGSTHRPPNNPFDWLPADGVAVEKEERIVNVQSLLETNPQALVQVEPCQGGLVRTSMGAQGRSGLLPMARDPGRDPAWAQKDDERPRAMSTFRMHLAGSLPHTAESPSQSRRSRRPIDAGAYLAHDRGCSADIERWTAGVGHNTALRARHAAIRWVRAGGTPI